MKKIIITVFLLFMCTLLLWSQGRGRQQLEASKAAFITTRVNMDVSTSQKFWPIYNKMQQELAQVRQSLRGGRGQNPGQLSDDEIRQHIEARFEAEQRELDIRRKYHKEFEKLLSIRQLGALYKAEEEFKREILREIQRRR